MKDQKGKYWYFISIGTCPVCGCESVYKERRYTPKPKDKKDRYNYYSLYDNCMDFYY